MKFSFEIEEKIANEDAEEIALEYCDDERRQPKITLRKPAFHNEHSGVKYPAETINLTDGEFDDIVERVRKYRKARDELYDTIG